MSKFIASEKSKDASFLSVPVRNSTHPMIPHTGSFTSREVKNKPLCPASDHC